MDRCICSKITRSTKNIGRATGRNIIGARIIFLSKARLSVSGSRPTDRPVFDFTEKCTDLQRLAGTQITFSLASYGRWYPICSGTSGTREDSDVLWDTTRSPCRPLMRIEGKFPGAFEAPRFPRAHYPHTGRSVIVLVVVIVYYILPLNLPYPCGTPFAARAAL